MTDIGVKNGESEVWFKRVPEGVVYVLAGAACVAAGVALGAALGRLVGSPAGQAAVRQGTQLAGEGFKLIEG